MDPAVEWAVLLQASAGCPGAALLPWASKVVRVELNADKSELASVIVGGLEVEWVGFGEVEGGALSVAEALVLFGRWMSFDT